LALPLYYAKLKIGVENCEDFWNPLQDAHEYMQRKFIFWSVSQAEEQKVTKICTF
jgi:hypothetical protein